jgi:hypothetical protein
VEAEKVFEKKYGYSPSSVNVSAKARAKFVEDHKREPDAFSDEDGDKLADYRLEIKHRDTVRLNALISDIDRGVQQYVTQQKQETERLQALNKDFVQEITTKENSQEILKFADERFKQQPVEMQKALSASLQRVQQGEGTYEDVSALRFFYESAELLYSQQQKESEASVAQGEPESKKEPGQPAAQVPDAAKKMEKKLEQAKSLPRSSQLNGGSANASTTVAELARKLEDGTITKEELEILKNGG